MKSGRINPKNVALIGAAKSCEAVGRSLTDEGRARDDPLGGQHLPRRPEQDFGGRLHGAHDIWSGPVAARETAIAFAASDLGFGPEPATFASGQWPNVRFGGALRNSRLVRLAIWPNPVLRIVSELVEFAPSAATNIRPPNEWA
jgi:hypothetical protein